MLIINNYFYYFRATFLNKLNKNKGYENTKLVLPPFHHLFHWKSNFNQHQIFWNRFFNLESLKKFTNVVDIWEFFDEIKPSFKDDQLIINEVYKLQHFDSMFENGIFLDKFEEIACTRKNKHGSNYYEYNNITENHINCLNFQGSASLLYNILEKYKHKYKHKNYPRIILFENAETVLHDYFGDGEYWKARRSMRFNEKLVTIANNYRRDYLGSTNELDLVQRPENWMNEKVC